MTMTANRLGDEDVARYLREHPEFFDAHPDLLSSMTVTHRHGGRTISLHERQLEVLREKNRAMERRLLELIRIGEENDAISARLQKWTREMLLASDPSRLPAAVVHGMTAGFGVPQVALRLWGVREAYRGLDCELDPDPDIVVLASGMKQPYCGPNAEFLAASWLPDAGRSTRSIALIALRRGADPDAFGMLVLGSADPGRFQQKMGTAFLERIGELASAALSRLVV